jgi:hypothetical protein
MKRGRPPWVPTKKQNEAIIELQKRTSDFEHAWREREEAIDRAIDLGVPDIHIASAAHSMRQTIARRRKEAV